MHRWALRHTFCLAAIAALTACGGGSTNGVPNTPGGGSGNGGPLTARIVGVGDSLTAGYQADGILGATGFHNPINPNPSLGPVPPGQENGFWALLDQQASGKPIAKAIADTYDPRVSPLPLVAAPGLNNQIVIGLTTPIAFSKPGNPCSADGGFNAAGYLLSGNHRTRMNPGSTTIRNVAVPGITQHEAVTLSQPQSTTCKPIPGIQGLLAQVVDGESSTFWPILGNFAGLGNRLTMVNAAASLHPTLATVWLGANDVLKYMGSGGRFTGGNRNAAQSAADTETAVTTLKSAGAKVVVANLPDILNSPYFMRVTIPTPLAKACSDPFRTYAACVMGNIIGAYQNPAYWTQRLAEQFHLATPNGCTPASTTSPCGYLTLQGALLVVQYCESLSNFCGPPGGKMPDLDNGKPGSGLGTYYITPQFAGKIQALDNAINAGIDRGAQATGSPLVDVHTIFAGLASGDPKNPYFAEASSLGTASVPCCTLAYAVPLPPGASAGGGLASFDGLHPSNTGYALLANAFIGVIDKAFGATIPPVDVKAVYRGTRCSNQAQCFPDPYAPH